ncbi:TPA: hypothetical protein ACN359_000269 [Vibrio parahaemolyticus]
MPKITLLLLATTIGIGITGAAFCVGVSSAFHCLFGRNSDEA